MPDIKSSTEGQEYWRKVFRIHILDTYISNDNKLIRCFYEFKNKLFISQISVFNLRSSLFRYIQIHCKGLNRRQYAYICYQDKLVNKLHVNNKMQLYFLNSSINIYKQFITLLLDFVFQRRFYICYACCPVHLSIVNYFKIIIIITTFICASNISALKLRKNQRSLY